MNEKCVYLSDNSVELFTHFKRHIPGEKCKYNGISVIERYDSRVTAIKERNDTIMTNLRAIHAACDRWKIFFQI